MTTLSKLQSQINTINRQRGSGERVNNDELKKGVQLRTEMLNLQRSNLNTGNIEHSIISQQIESRKKEYDQINENIKLRVEGAKKVHSAEEA